MSIEQLEKPTPHSEPIKDRIRRMWGNWRNRHVGKAMQVLAKEFEKDQRPGSYYDAWVSNIAMPLYDRQRTLDISDAKQCNEFAKELMNHFFGVKP
jgi:hypothetical protein